MSTILLKLLEIYMYFCQIYMMANKNISFFSKIKKFIIMITLPLIIFLSITSYKPNISLQKFYVFNNNIKSSQYEKKNLRHCDVTEYLHNKTIVNV